jgi:hypothetical protein
METHPSPHAFHSTVAEKRPRASRAEYQKQRRGLLHEVYFPSLEDKAEKRALAEAEGYAGDFGGWLLLKVNAALSGNIYPAGYVEGLEEESADLKVKLEAAREEREDYRRETKALAAQKDALLALLMDTPGGAEAAGDFLRSVSGKPGVGA